MKQYHKIQTVFKRDPENNNKTLLEGQYSIPEFNYLKNNSWVFTEKVDGTNIRVMWDGEKVSYGGKTDKANTPPFLLTELRAMFDPSSYIFANKFEDVPVCLYGEGYGAKIQKVGSKYIPDGQSFVLFDVKIGDWWLQRPDVEDIAAAFGIQAVPVIGSGTLSEMVEWARSGIDSKWGAFRAEGIVARPATELVSRNGNRIITKIKCKDFQKSRR